MKQNNNRNWRVFGFLLLIALGFVLSGIKSIVLFITNYQWFKFNDYLATFLVKVKTEVFLIIPLMLLLTVGLYFYLKQLKRDYYHAAHIFYNANADRHIHKGMIVFTTLFAFLSV